MHPTLQPAPGQRSHEVQHHVVGPRHLQAQGLGEASHPAADHLHQLAPAFQVAHGPGLCHHRQRFLDGLILPDSVGLHLRSGGGTQVLVGAPHLAQHGLGLGDGARQPAVESLVEGDADELVGAADVVGHHPDAVALAEVGAAHLPCRVQRQHLVALPGGHVGHALHHVQPHHAALGHLRGQRAGGVKVEGAGGGAALERRIVAILLDHHHAGVGARVDRQARVHEAAIRQFLVGAAQALQPLAELGRALVLVRERRFAHQGHDPAAGLQQRVGVAHMLDVPSVAEGRVHDDAVVAAVDAAMPHADQLVPVVPTAQSHVRRAVRFQRSQHHLTAAHAAAAHHHAFGPVGRAEHVAPGEELARLHAQEVAGLNRVALLLK